MILYNVTCLVSWNIHDQWLDWMKKEHIPEVLSTGLFTHHRILRLLDVDESEGATYAIQYFTEQRAQYDHYITTFSSALREKTIKKWGDQVVAFRTVMQTVD